MSYFKEIRFSGFGGQGVVLTGIILARAAAIYGGLQVVQSQSYGAESRGGACLSDVIISTEKIDYPACETPDILVAMSLEAAKKHIRSIKPGGIFIIDEEMVTNPPSGNYGHLIGIHATKIAQENFKNRIVANMIMLGALLAIEPIIDLNTLEHTVQESVPKDTIKINIQALRQGFKQGDIAQKKIQKETN